MPNKNQESNGNTPMQDSEVVLREYLSLISTSLSYNTVRVTLSDYSISIFYSDLEVDDFILFPPFGLPDSRRVHAPCLVLHFHISERGRKSPEEVTRNIGQIVDAIAPFRTTKTLAACFNFEDSVVSPTPETLTEKEEASERLMFTSALTAELGLHGLALDVENKASLSEPYSGAAFNFPEPPITFVRVVYDYERPLK